MSQPWRQNENWRNRGPPSGDTSQQPGSSRDPQRQRSRAQSRPYDRPLQVVTNTRRMPPKTTLTEAKLMDELDRAVNRYQKPKPKPSKVNVLGVMWDLDNVNSKPQYDRLMDLFAKRYGYKVEHHLLVAQKSSIIYLLRNQTLGTKRESRMPSTEPYLMPLWGWARTIFSSCTTRVMV